MYSGLRWELRLLATQLGFQLEGGLAFLEPAAFLWKEKLIYWFSYLQQIESGFEESLQKQEEKVCCEISSK